MTALWSKWDSSSITICRSYFTLPLPPYTGKNYNDALVSLPRSEAVVSFGTLFFLFLAHVDHGCDARCLCAYHRAECDEWLW